MYSLGEPYAMSLDQIMYENYTPTPRDHFGGGTWPTGKCRPWRVCHSTLSLTAIGCHSLGIHTLILLPLLSFSAKMTVPPLARQGRGRRPAPLPDQL
jgi:hypothetical protein